MHRSAPISSSSLQSLVEEKKEEKAPLTSTLSTSSTNTQEKIVDLLAAYKRLHKPEKSHEAYNADILHYLMSHLLGMDIRLAFVTDQEKYRVHLLEHPNEADSDVLGWQVEKFLPLLISHYFETLFNIREGYYDDDVDLKEMARNADELKKITAALFSEIVITFETLELVRKINEVHSFKNLNRQKEMMDPLIHSFVTKLLSLNEGEEFVFATGWVSHVVYVSFKCRLAKDHKEIEILIHNAGSSRGTYPSDHAYFANQSLHDSVEVAPSYSITAPRLIGKVHIKDVSKIIRYIEGLLSIVDFAEKEIAVRGIYDFKAVLGEPVCDALLPVVVKQTIDNCVNYGWKVAQEVRIDNLPLAQWLHKQEELLIARRIWWPIVSMSEFRDYFPVLMSSEDIQIDLVFLMLKKLEFQRLPSVNKVRIKRVISALTEEKVSDDLPMSDVNQAAVEMNEMFRLLRDMRVVDLSNQNLDDKQVAQLVNLLPCFPRLCSLDLSSNRLTDESGDLLVKFMRRPEVKLKSVKTSATLMGVHNRFFLDSPITTGPGRLGAFGKRSLPQSSVKEVVNSDSRLLLS